MANLLCDYKKAFVCSSCSEMHKQLRGCTKFNIPKLPQSPGTRMIIDGKLERFDVCPEGLVNNDLRLYLPQYAHYVKNNLWYPGSAGEQPAKYLRVMEIIESQVAEANRIEMEKQKALRRLGSQPITPDMALT